MRSYVCVVCGRKLSDPNSVQQGMGPICYARMQAREGAEEEKYHDGMLDLDEYPLDEAVVCIRGAGGVKTNVPHLVERHSPNGYEWGYGGSGPAELALNICEYYVRMLGNDGYAIGTAHEVSSPGHGLVHDVTYGIYQTFKGEFIAGMEHQGRRIPANEIMTWIKAHLQKQREMF